LDGFENEWIFDFPSVVREIELWAVYPTLQPYRERSGGERFASFGTALMPSFVIEEVGKVHRQISVAFGRKFERPEVTSFTALMVDASENLEWCKGKPSLLDHIDSVVGVRRRFVGLSPASLSDGLSSSYLDWVVLFRTPRAGATHKQLVATTRPDICSVALSIGTASDQPRPKESNGENR
jgi:hypothetical protein